MNDQRRDRDLQELFSELRTEDAAKAPDFEATMAAVRSGVQAMASEESGADASEVVHIQSKRSDRDRAGARSVRRPRVAWMGGVGVLAAAAIAAVMLVGRGSMSDEAFEELVTAYASDPALGAWQSSTDALLELPGREIVTTVPRIGRPSLLGVPGLYMSQPDGLDMGRESR